jgi:hypothetical protein
MHVALHDGDRTKFPNLALMKLSAWHRAQGDRVSWFFPILGYDKLYSSKVFTYTPPDVCLPLEATQGGTGYGGHQDLPDEVEHQLPDYELYNIDYGMGFLTRGCDRRCPWCLVPDKEGSLRAHAEFGEFQNPASAKMVLLDNNVLASDHGIQQIEEMQKANLRLDFNQGLDARRVGRDAAVARLLASCRWIGRLRFACDTKAQMAHVEKAIKAIRSHGCRTRVMCYVLVQDIPDALERVEFLRKLGVDPFAQLYRDPASLPGAKADPQIVNFVRWVNRKAIFKTVAWEDYQRHYRRGRS